MTTIETQSERASFGGETGFYGRPYETCDGEPRFAVYTPPGAAGGPVPVLYCLDGLTSTEGTLMIKGGAQRLAAEHGLMLVAPATGPRTADVPGEDGFYVDATEGPWSRHHRMYSYVTLELPSVVEENFLPRRPRRLRPLHGRHGALVCALRYPDLFRSVSALASIFAPHACTLGREGLHRLPQGNRETWKANDASELVGDRPFPDGRNVLVDQGLADQSLEEQLRPQSLEEARAGAGQPLTLNRREG